MKKSQLYPIIAVFVAIVTFIAFAYGIKVKTSPAQEDASQIYALIRDRVATVAEQAKDTLKRLGEEEHTLSAKNDDCAIPLAAYLNEKKDVFDVFLRVKPNGELDCTPKSAVSGVSFSDRIYYKKVIEQKDFVIGEFLVGKVSGLPVLAVAQPFFEGDGALKYILVAGLKTKWLESILAENNKFDESLIVELQDASGTLLSYFATGRLAIPGEGRRIEIARYKLFPGASDAEVVIFQKT
ncbi:PDC sensor domain-containing protein [Sneathiella aquimaris]|uniref:PDC sensor domain-containing protein n=1 Tax=Sneathiella aquimaris TaxID=2599305 RepID=UPI00146C8A50|nr:hypothetical protein [Sneathiella aquimaris]